MVNNILCILFIILGSLSGVESQPLDEETSSQELYQMRCDISEGGVFEFSQKYDYEIDTYSFESDDFRITTTLVYKNKIDLDLLAERQDDFGHFTLAINFINGLYEINTYYIYMTDDCAFVSSSSDEEAWLMWAEYVYDSNLYSNEELVEIYNYFSLNCFSEEEIITGLSASHDGGSYGTNPTTIVKGSLSFIETDSEFGTQCKHPLKETKVSLCVDDSESLGDKFVSTYTDEDGYFKFTLDKGNYPSLYNSSYHSYSVIFYSQGQTYKLIDADDMLFSYKSETLYNQENQTTINLGETIILYDETQNIKAFSICCALGFAEEFILNYNQFPSDYGTIVYRYPAWFGKSWTFDLHGAFVDSKASDYSTIIHEYGHYVAQTTGIFGRKWYQAFGKKGEHAESDDNFGSKLSKDVAMMKTWDESIANIFAMLVCSHYDELMDSKSYFSSGIRTMINSANDFRSINKDSSEAQEDAVIAYLWNLFSDTNTYEQISLSEKQFLNVLLQEGTYTLTTFINIFESTYPEYIFQSGSLLQECHIAPRITSASYTYATKEFILSFIPYGSPSLPNDMFNILFYSDDYSLLGRIDDIKLNVDSNTEDITYSTGKLVIVQPFVRNFNLTVYVSIEGYQDTSSVSGPYRSGLFSFETSSGIISKVIT